MPALIPELYVDDLDRSIAFYAALGFVTLYSRPAERFAMIEREGAQLMLEEPIGRSFKPPLTTDRRGAGINLQITVSEADTLAAVIPPNSRIVLPIETRKYCRHDDEVTVRQLVVADPDGYLLRFSQVVEVTPARPPATP